MQVVLLLPLTRWQKVPQAIQVESDQAESRSCMTLRVNFVASSGPQFAAKLLAQTVLEIFAKLPLFLDNAIAG